LDRQGVAGPDGQAEAERDEMIRVAGEALGTDPAMRGVGCVAALAGWLQQVQQERDEAQRALLVEVQGAKLLSRGEHLRVMKDAAQMLGESWMDETPEQENERLKKNLAFMDGQDKLAGELLEKLEQAEGRVAKLEGLLKRTLPWLDAARRRARDRGRGLDRDTVGKLSSEARAALAPGQPEGER
jgi:hypothetical protein